MASKSTQSEQLPETDGGRGSRSDADYDRQNDTGTALTMEERVQILRNEHTGDILPDINIQKPRGYNPEMHYFWASTTNKSDTIYRRQRLGYELVRADSFPDLDAEYGVSEGQFQGCISVNEMLLMQIPKVLACELLKINHHEKPLAEEMRLKANAVQKGHVDREGNELGKVDKEDQGFRQIVDERRPPKSFL